jgi:hypothetical protein
MIKFLLVLILTLPAYTAFAQLSEADTALITECTANIDPGKKQLSPATADKCIKGLNGGAPALIQRYSQEDPEAAAELIGYNNALLDLKRTVVKQEGISGVKALARILEKSDCALCDLNLGPRPELAFDWIGSYASDRLDIVKKDVRTWDALGDIRTTSLSSADYGKNKAGWNSQEIIERYLELGRWAKAETVRLEAASKVPGAGAKLNVAVLAGILREDLTLVGDKASLAKLDAITAAAGVKEEAPKPSVADKKSKDMAGASDRLSAITPDGQMDYLAQTFDKTAAAKPVAIGAGKPGAAGTKPGTVKPMEPVKMTAAEETALGEAMLRMEKGKPTGYLADVMAQTDAGKRTNEFYSDPKYAKAGTNKLDFSFVREPGVFGYWNPDEKQIRINSEVAEKFAAERGLTVPEMMKDKAAMSDFALYVSPTMVHEAEHQNQTARAIDGGYDFRKYTVGSDDPYTRAKENLSNKWSSEHMIEYCSKNGGAGCFKSFHEMHADNADKFMQGGLDALDTLKAPLYPRIDSMEGGAAREFKSAQTYAAQLKTLETLNRTNPAAMTAQQKTDMKDYRELMDTRFKWYTSIYQESTTAEAEALAFRKKYGTAGLGLTMPAL